MTEPSNRPFSHTNSGQALSRRDVLRFAGGAAVVTASGAVMPELFAANSTKPDKKVRIGIVGGRFGLGFQFRVWWKRVLKGGELLKAPNFGRANQKTDR